jgi:hypothetical protein
MLTPAEELGLSGRRLHARVQRAFDALRASDQRRLLAQVTRESKARRLLYLREGRAEVIPLFATPLAVLPDQVGYVHSVSQTLHRALLQLAPLYFEDPRVRKVLELPAPEEVWLRELWTDSHREANPVFGRLDAVADFAHPHWKETLRFLEPNLGGVGGLQLAPVADEVIRDVVLPRLRERDPSLELSRHVDVRDQLMEYLLEHLEALGRRGRTLCFIEPTAADTGPEEQAALAEYFERRYRVRVFHADPADLSLHRGEVCVRGEPIDIAYRDYEVRDLQARAAAGLDVAPMRALLRENRMVSSIAAELDGKSCFEVFTDPELSRAHFTAEERQVFRRHVLWTRVVSERKTTLPDGHSGDLVEFADRARESLVLKPDRSYGGQGVVIGTVASDAEWSDGLERALRGPDRFVVQQITPLPVYEFPVAGPDGRVYREPFYTVLGFAPTSFGTAILGRASQKQVVNVAQRGGLVSVLVGAPR